MISLLDIPKRWNALPIDDLFDIVGGIPAPQDDASFSDDGIPFVRMKDVGRGHLTRSLQVTDDKLRAELVAHKKWKPVPDGSILMPRSGSVGLNHRALLTCPAIIVSHVCALVPRDQRIWSPFAYYASCQFDMRKLTKKTTGLDSLNFGDLKRVLFPLPPIDEQKRIAAILDQADELRRKRQRAIHRLNQLGQAVFHDMFGDAMTNPKGWRTAQLGDIVRSGDKINYGVVQPGDDVENGVPLVRVGDLLSGYIDPTKVKQIDATIEAGYKRSRLAGDEILIGCVGSIGTVALAHEGLRGANIARAVARVPVDAGIAMRDFIAEQIKSHVIQRYFTSETRTVAQPTLNIGLIVSAPIILPPLSEQKKFAAVMAQVRANLKNFVDHGSTEDELFASLQHRAFQGKL